MEIIRSIDYTSIGTKHWNGSAWVYGIPAGELIEEEDVSVNTTLYHVDTFVQYVDDTFDGVTPADTIPTDYKRVRVTVSWGNRTPEETVALFGSFAPNGIESSTGGGVLSINVLSNSGAGVSGANVRIQNAAASIDTTVTTDATGNVTLPGAPAASQAYILTVSKSGYYGAATYAPYPTSAYSPVNVHATVIANVLNQTSIVMDQDVDIQLATEDPLGADIPNIGFTLTGGRLLGTDPITSASVYQFTDTSTTDSAGEESYSNESYGQYTITVPSTSDYEFWKVTPETPAANLVDIAPGVSADLKLVMVPKNSIGVWITVVNDADGEPISGASVKLTNVSASYDVTLTTDIFGTVYFPESGSPMVPGSYDVEISATGFDTETENLGVGATLNEQTYNMIAD
jgi:hypothetical protein